MVEYWNDGNNPMHPASAADYLPPEQLRQTQLHRLKRVLKRCYDNVELFRNRMDQSGLLPEDVQSLEDLAKLPFTSKIDLRDTYPFGLFASPMGDVVRLHASSGTTGKPIVVGYTEGDIELWKSVVVRCFAACGLRRGDMIQNAFGYGLFTGGLGIHHGAEELGATIVPISGGNSERQMQLMEDFGTTAITCTPSYFVRLIEFAQEKGYEMTSMPLKVGIFGAEPWSDEMRLRIENDAGIKAYDIYGLSEIIGPGVGIECAYQDGLHIFEDHFYPEIVNPETLMPVPDGEYGELVITTLTKEAMPMIRYRTRDITKIISEPCTCGRTIRRIARIGRRSDDMMIIRGVNIFPGQIEAALLASEGTLPHYQIVLTNDGTMDQLEVQVEVTKEIISDNVGAMEQAHAKISNAIANITGIRIKLSLVGPHSIPRSEGKAKRVLDLRNK